MVLSRRFTVFANLFGNVFVSTKCLHKERFDDIPVPCFPVVIVLLDLRDLIIFFLMLKLSLYLLGVFTLDPDHAVFT